MPRAKKDAKILNIRIAAHINERLEQFCRESGMTKTVAVEKILDKFFVAYFDKPEDERTVFKG